MENKKKLCTEPNRDLKSFPFLKVSFIYSQSLPKLHQPLESLPPREFGPKLLQTMPYSTVRHLLTYSEALQRASQGFLRLLK